MLVKIKSEFLPRLFIKNYNNRFEIEGNISMKINPYLSPDSVGTTPMTHTKKHFILAIIACCFYATPVIGNVFSKLLIQRAYHQFNSSSEIINADEFVKSMTNFSMLFVYTFGIGIIGIVFMVLVIKKQPDQWFFYSGMIISILWAISIFPLGLVIGIIMFSVLWINEHKINV